MMRSVPFYASETDGQHTMLSVYRSLLEYFLHRRMDWDGVASFTGFNAGRANRQMAAMGFDIESVEQPELQDIDTLLADGRVIATVSVHGSWLLILDKMVGQYVVHDPGSGLANRMVDIGALTELIGDNVTGFKLKDRRNLRLDQYVIDQFPQLSRAYAERLIKEGKVLVNGKPTKPGYKLRETDDVSIDYDPEHAEPIPDIDLPVLYEDEDCIVINKPAGVLTHSVGKLHGEATVATFIRSRLHNAPVPNVHIAGLRNSKVNQDNQRAGIVHRLDRATSGVIICAKTPYALAWLQKQFHDRHAHKAYAAIITGQLHPEAAVIEMPIERNPKAPATFRVGANGKHATTTYKTLAVNGQYSLLELKPQTGRTHQLRVHLAHQHHPIVGDYMYDGQRAERLYLHAWRLDITLPNGKPQTFEAPLPTDFNELVNYG